MQQPQLLNVSIKHFSSVLNFILHARLESFLSKLSHILATMHSLNSVMLIIRFSDNSCVSTLFFHTNTHIRKESLTLLFTLELKKISCPLIFRICGKIALVLKEYSKTTPISVFL